MSKLGSCIAFRDLEFMEASYYVSPVRKQPRFHVS